MLRITLIFISLHLITRPVLSQFSFERIFDVKVMKNDKVLSRAWEGGLNYPIFSNGDIDGNGISDIIAFDKSGQRLIGFLNENLLFTPLNFNEDFIYGYDHKWMLFNDYNCDGHQDIFAGEANGITVFKNNGDFSFSDGIKIQAETELGIENIFVSTTDIPGIADVDGDGDIDILTFESSGSFIEFYENNSMDNSHSCGLSFTKKSNCWGQIKESDLNNTILFNQDCNASLNKTLGGGVHAGSTITILDHNKDGRSDILLSDLTSNDLVLLTNSSVQEDKIISMDMNFPIYDKPISLNTFPYASLVDVNQNGKKDLLISSNSESGDNTTILWYENKEGGDGKDTFYFQHDQFLVGDMLDFGSASYPIFVDENQDGLMDLLVGNHNNIKDGSKSSSFCLLRNVGTLNQPAFEVIDEDYLHFSTTDEHYLYPAIGDIDNDGDDDLLIGLENGKVLYYHNQAEQNQPYDFILASGNFEGIDVGKYAAPTLFDVNEDGAIDLLLGNESGSLTYFENQSTFGYDFTVKQSNWGNISTQEIDRGYFYGFSTPFLFEHDSSIHLLVGGASGKIQFYYDIKKEDPSGFELDHANFCTKDGGYSKPVMYDLNNDGFLELVNGSLSGGLAYYQGIAPNYRSAPNVQKTIDYQIHGEVILVQNPKLQSIKIIDLKGRTLQYSTGPSIIAPKSRGTYIMLIQLGDEFIPRAFIK